jgi:hypothetical protein
VSSSAPPAPMPAPMPAPSHGTPPYGQTPTFSKGGWGTVSSPSITANADTHRVETNTPERMPSRGGWSAISPSPSQTFPSVPPPSDLPTPPVMDPNVTPQARVPKQSKSSSVAAAADQSRGSWQSFQKGRRR